MLYVYIFSSLAVYFKTRRTKMYSKANFGISTCVHYQKVIPGERNKSWQPRIVKFVTCWQLAANVQATKPVSAAWIEALNFKVD